MNPRTRALLLKVHGGDKTNLPYLLHVWRHKECNRILHYLLHKKLTGNLLSEFIVEKCGGSPIHFLGKITREIAKTNVAPKLIKGVNFL